MVCYWLLLWVVEVEEIGVLVVVMVWSVVYEGVLIFLIGG